MKTTFRKLRERHGLTQDELAERLRVSQPTVSNLEAGARHLHPELAVKAARILGVGAWELQETHSREVHAMALKSALGALKDLGMDDPRKLAAVLATPNGRRAVRMLTTKAIEAGDDETAQSVMGAVEKAVGGGSVDAALKASKQVPDDDDDEHGGRDAFGRRRRAASKDRDSFGRSQRFASSEKSRDSLGRARAEDVVERDRFGRRVRKTFSGDQRASAEANEEAERQERERRAEQERERQESERAAWAERQERQARQARAERSAAEIADVAATKASDKLADAIVERGRRGQRGRGPLTPEERERARRIIEKPL